MSAISTERNRYIFCIKRIKMKPVFRTFFFFLHYVHITWTCSLDVMNHMLFHNSGLHLLKHSIYYTVVGILSVNKDLNMFFYYYNFRKITLVFRFTADCFAVALIIFTRMLCCKGTTCTCNSVQVCF